jgi:hypothetical protein
MNAPETHLLRFGIRRNESSQPCSYGEGNPYERCLNFNPHIIIELLKACALLLKSNDGQFKYFQLALVLTRLSDNVQQATSFGCTQIMINIFKLSELNPIT